VARVGLLGLLVALALLPASVVGGLAIDILHLARENARRMGGDITVVSRPSRGSVFTLSLPLDPGPAPGTAPAKVQVGS
jgi:hypothetical protein